MPANNKLPLVKVYEGKPLSEVAYEDVVGFLELDRAEAEDLDYKQEWQDKHVRTVCAMANTAGGDLLFGVKERRDGATNTNRPDPGDVPGIERKPRDLAQSVAAKIRARTRPSLAPEVEAVPVDGKPGRVVLIVRVAESPEAPHEVRLGPSPEIPVRRRDNTESAGIDDVERLLRRRDALRDPAARKVDIAFFEDQLRPREGGRPPVVAVWMRPRLAPGLRFDLDHTFDEQLEYLFRKHHLGGETLLTPFASGLALQGQRDDEPISRIEVREDGTIRGAWVLPYTPGEVVPDADFGGRPAGWEESREPYPPQLQFDEISSKLIASTRFAAATYGTRRTAVEVEFLFGLHRCQGFDIGVPELLWERPKGVIFDPSGFASYRGRVPGHPMGNDPTYGSVSVRTIGYGSDAKPENEDLLRLLRAASRAVGVSAPDARLEHYLR